MALKIVIIGDDLSGKSGVLNALLGRPYDAGAIRFAESLHPLLFLTPSLVILEYIYIYIMIY